MAKLTDIKYRIDQLDGGTFQNLCDAYLVCKDYGVPYSLGMKTGTDKTAKGNPDTYFLQADGKYVLVMYTTKKDTFEVPSDIVTPMEHEEQRRQQEHDEAVRERQRNADQREFTARKKAGLLTPEEQEADEKRRARNRAWQKEWRDKRKAEAPPKPPRPRSVNALLDCEKAGLPLTAEEQEKLAAYRQKKNEYFKEWRKRKQEAKPPKPRTVKELIAAKEAGEALTAEEEERMYKSRNRKKLKREELIRQAEIDPDAAAKLAEIRAYNVNASTKSRRKMYDEAAAGDPEAILRYENHLATRRENYHKKQIGGNSMNELKERIHENGIDYILCGDYYIPEWEIPKCDRSLGHYGNLRKTYLKEYRPALYNHLLLQNKLHDHCADVNEQTQRRLEVMMEQITHEWGVDENLKHRDQMGWVGLMNQAKHCAEESIKQELIYA